jgi:hypothetical protein
LEAPFPTLETEIRIIEIGLGELLWLLVPNIEARI